MMLMTFCHECPEDDMCKVLFKSDEQPINNLKSTPYCSIDTDQNVN